MATQPEGAAPSKIRQLHGWVDALVQGLLFALTAIGSLWALDLHVYLNLVVYTEQYLALILCIGLGTIFLTIKARKSEPAGIGVPWYDWLLAAATVVVAGYIVVEYPRLISEAGIASWDKLALGTIAILLVMEATRRVIGWFLIWVAVIFILYARYSHLMPEIIEAPSTEWDRLIIYLYLDTNSIIGLPLRVFATIIIAFILFGRVLYAMNADKFLTEASLAIMGRYRGGPAKVAVGASSLFGTISGSVVSNVVMDGPITIPMMQRTGYPGHIAAAIEALASTGGQIMPPVMGITAFLIADWLSIPYSDVVIAAIMPAILYYLALFVQVDLEAAKRGLVGLPAADLPRLAKTIRSGWVFVVPFAVLVYTLVFDAWEPGKSAMAAVIAAIAVGLIQPETRPTLRKLWIACIETGRTLLDLVAIVAIAGLVIGALQISGLAFSLSLILTSLASGSLFALLLLTAALSIVLGMGLPSAVIYILLAVLVAPGLVEFGVPELAAHMYLFYFGMLSMITPPMCFATFAAATIAGCDFWKAGWAGVRLGIVAYIIPFMFVYQPEILLQGEPLRIVLSLGSALIAVTFLAAAVAGYVFAPLDPVKRTLLTLAAIALVPSPAAGTLAALSNIAGLVVGLGVCVLQWRASARQKLSGAGGAADAVKP